MDAQNRVILVVEDDPDISDFVSAVLERAGYAVNVAPNGAVALERVSDQAPRAILLDMQMPVMDGWEFVQHYHAQPGTPVPIVVMTAAHDAPIRAAEVHAVGVLGKPFDLDDLLRAVALAVGSAA
jgi:CheY-like chemotaxis protein